HGRVKDDSHLYNRWLHLFEYFQPFPAYRSVLVIRESRDVSARSREALDEAAADWIGYLHEHDWYAAGFPVQSRRCRCAAGQDHVRCHSHQFFRVCTHEVGVSTGPAIFDPEIVPDRPT